MIKPHLACDADLNKLRGVVWVMPKLDGVRSLHINNAFVGRSLKPHANVNLEPFFGKPEFANLDGELTIGSVCDGDTCRRTSSGVRLINGPRAEKFDWHLFDDLTLTDKTYEQRYASLSWRVETEIKKPNVFVVDFVECRNADEVMETHLAYVGMGYEGSIIRDPLGSYKSGRATVIENAFLRVKDFVEEEFLITSLEEGVTNLNVAQTNELGRTFRTTHKENMAPNGMVGALLGTDLKTGDFIRVAAGCLTHEERRKYFLDPELILGQIGKYRTMKYGKKDKPRFPTFRSIRARSDMSK